MNKTTKSKTDLIVNKDAKVAPKKKTATDRSATMIVKVPPSEIEAAKAEAKHAVSTIESVDDKHLAFREIVLKGYNDLAPKEFHMLLLCEKAVNASRKAIENSISKVDKEVERLEAKILHIREEHKEDAFTAVSNYNKLLAKSKELEEALKNTSSNHNSQPLAVKTDPTDVTTLEINEGFVDDLPDLEEVEHYLVDEGHKFEWRKLLDKSRVIDQDKAFFIRQVKINCLDNEDITAESYKERAAFTSSMIHNAIYSDRLWL